MSIYLNFGLFWAVLQDTILQIHADICHLPWLSLFKWKVFMKG